jgi:hypothetical protein
MNAEKFHLSSFIFNIIRSFYIPLPPAPIGFGFREANGQPRFPSAAPSSLEREKMKT